MRYYFNNSSPLCFGEVSAGYYNLHEQILDEFWEVNNLNLNNLGFQCGMGLDIEVLKNIFVLPKINYSILLTPSIYNSITYFELKAGLKYIF